MPADPLSVYENPPVPEFTPLPVATTPQPLATVLTSTTTAQNGPNGSVDGGGQIDRIAAGRYADANAWSQNTFGMPLVVPTVQTAMQRLGITILGAFVGGYHGAKRNPGKNKMLSMIGYGLAGVIFPLGTLGVAAIQGYAKPRRR